MVIHSPCVARCGLNDDDYCMGCYRHIDEIVNWSRADDAQKAQICSQLADRKAQFEGQKNSQILSRAKWLASESRSQESN